MDKKKILENIDKVLSFHKDELIKTSEPTFNFKEIQYLIEEIFEIFEKLKNNSEYFERIYSNNNSVENTFQHITNTLEEIYNFNPLKNNNPNSTRQEYMDRLKRYFEDLENTFLYKFRVYIIEKELSNEKNNQISKELEKSRNQVKKTEEEFKSLIETYKTTTLQTGVGVYEDVFKEEAEENKKFADNFWNNKILGLILGYPLLLISINVFHYYYIRTFDYYIISINLIVTSFFILILLQFFKMYNSHMHLYKLNKHRQNSLRVFEAFIKTADDEKTKNIIRLQATKTIFESGDTGFIKNVESKQQDLNINNLIGRNSE